MILHWFYWKISFPWKEWSIHNLIALSVCEYAYLLLCNSGEVEVSPHSVPLLPLFPEKNQLTAVFQSWCLCLDFWVKVQVIINCLTLLHVDVFVFILEMVWETIFILIEPGASKNSWALLFLCCLLYIWYPTWGRKSMLSSRWDGNRQLAAGSHLLCNPWHVLECLKAFAWLKMKSKNLLS